VARPERAQERIRIGCSLYRNHIRLLAARIRRKNAIGQFTLRLSG
jgi:hypothetical protein